MSSQAYGHGIATIAGTSVLDVWYPAPALGPLQGSPDQSLQSLVGKDEMRGVTRELVSLEIDLTAPPRAPSDQTQKQFCDCDAGRKVRAPTSKMVDNVDQPKG